MQLPALGCCTHRGNVMLTTRILSRVVKMFFVLCLPLIMSAEIFAAQTPLAVIQAGTDKALGILNRDCGMTPKNSLRDRRDEILQVLDGYFNFQEMARRSLGPSWKDQSPEKQREFVRLFKQLLFNTYLDRMEMYSCSDERIVYEHETLEGEYGAVNTRVILNKSKKVEVHVDYRLKQENGGWKVYDVIVEGVSLIENYRGQLSSILARESFDSLLKRLHERVSAT